MDQTGDNEVESIILYATFWRMLSLAVHRYGSSPTGQMLMVITMVILDRYGYEPTVTELAEITQLPKSSISRYVAAEMKTGMLEEFIDPGDRRRRRLRPTALAKKEQKWHAEAICAIGHQIRDLERLFGPQSVSGPKLVSVLKKLNQGLLPYPGPGGPAGG